MNNTFTVEETNLLSIYHEGSKAQLIENMTAALPYLFIDLDVHRSVAQPVGNVDKVYAPAFFRAG